VSKVHIFYTLLFIILLITLGLAYFHLLFFIPFVIEIVVFEYTSIRLNKLISCKKNKDAFKMRKIDELLLKLLS
jgi:hypothetical protein